MQLTWTVLLLNLGDLVQQWVLFEQASIGSLVGETARQIAQITAGLVTTVDRALLGVKKENMAERNWMPCQKPLSILDCFSVNQLYKKIVTNTTAGVK